MGNNENKNDKKQPKYMAYGMCFGMIAGSVVMSILAMFGQFVWGGLAVGLGLMIGIKTTRPAKDVVNECIEKGVLCLSAKTKVRLLPALNIPMETLKKAIDIIKEVCAKEA